MFGEIGFDKLLMLLVMFLLLFGAKRIPEIGRSLGKGIREFKGSLAGLDEPVEPARVLGPGARPPTWTIEPPCATHRRCAGSTADVPRCELGHADGGSPRGAATAALLVVGSRGAGDGRGAVRRLHVPGDPDARASHSAVRAESQARVHASDGSVRHRDAYVDRVWPRRRVADCAASGMGVRSPRDDRSGGASVQWVIGGSLVLFAAGVALAWGLVLPLAVQWLMGLQTDALTPVITAREYFSFVVDMALAFGLGFQLPIVVVGLVWLDIVTPERLVQLRRVALFGSVLVGALLDAG